MDPAPSASRQPPLLPVALVAAMTIIVFLPSLSGQFLNYDDDVNFLSNHHYRGFSRDNLTWMFTDTFALYMPITWLTLAFDFELWGMNPFGYHLTSMLIHAVNGVLFYFLLLELLKRARPDEKTGTLAWAAAAGALLFSIHPLRVESVAWITERRDVTSGFFVLLTMLAYVRMTDETPGSTGWLKWLVLTLAAFIGSLLGKPTAMTLPLILLPLDFYPLRRFTRHKPKTLILEKIPFVVLMIGAAFLTSLSLRHAAAVYSAQEYPLLQRLAQPGYRISFYVLKTLLPLRLSPLYFYRPDLGLPQVLGWLALSSLTILACVRLRKNPAPAVAWISYGFLIAPVSGLVQAGPHFAADRYTYLACLPFAALFASAVPLARRDPARRAAQGAAVVILAVLAGLTVRQCGVWRDSVALWDQAISIDPDVYFSYQNRGSARLELQDWTGALADLDRAIALNPNYAKSWYGRGLARANLGDHRAALGDFNVCLTLDPGQAGALSARGLSRAKLGDVDGALADADAALRLAPDSFQPNFHRGLIRFQFGDMWGAIADFSRTIQFAPDSPLAYFNRGLAASRIGRLKEAVADFRRAVELRPDYAEALAQLGLSRALLNEPGPGMADLTQSLRIKPDPATFLHRAAVRGLLNDFRGSIEDCDQSLRMKPDVPEAYLRRGAAFLGLGDRPAAARDFHKALDVAPPSWPQRRQAEDLLLRALPK